MLTLFKKSKTEQQIVAEIHNEFDTAEDRLLEQADNLLKELNIPTETKIEQKAIQLKELGFVNSELVKQAEKLSDNREKQRITIVTTREQAELIRYYKQTYPFQKFLTESELERICEKYNLIYAPVKNYTKDVPDRNIEEIANCAMLKTSDVPKNKIWVELSYDGILHIGNTKAKLMGFPRIIKDINFESWIPADKYMKTHYPELTVGMGYVVNTVKNYEENKGGLFIAAPQSHFNLKGLTKKGKYSFLSIRVTEVKDPIVFRYVRGGVQVLSKWGLEAQDKDLVNEKLN